MTLTVYCFIYVNFDDVTDNADSNYLRTVIFHLSRYHTKNEIRDDSGFQVNKRKKQDKTCILLSY